MRERIVIIHSNFGIDKNTEEVVENKRICKCMTIIKIAMVNRNLV